ncbi:MAG: BlaI/MecI/CopY family transcriptional regulator [Hymenobacter sp.]|nr:BlaI/MecI/CopY family transcriptional regulator [Hymenobacter sp.]
MERLTQPEEDALRVLWPLPGGGFVKDVLDELPTLSGTAPRPPYTTLASTLRNLERKGYVRAEKLGNSFRFVPLVTADDYQRRSLGTLVKQHFQNSYKDLVSFFAQEQKISAQELQEIIDLIKKQKPQ